MTDAIHIYIPMKDAHIVPDVIFEEGWKGSSRERLLTVFKERKYIFIRYIPSTKRITIFFTDLVPEGISLHNQEAKDILLNILLEI